MKRVKNSLRTIISTPREKVYRAWHLIDAKNVSLGKSAVKVAELLQGRKKVQWSPQQDIGDNVVVINVAQAKLTGNKTETKTYYHHTKHLGHLRAIKYLALVGKKPTEAFYRAVYGMLPKKRFKKDMLNRMHIFALDKHPYQKQFSKNK